MKSLTEDSGELMTLDEFIEDSKNGSLIDYDGFGYYSDGVEDSNIKVYPSDVFEGSVQFKWTHVSWYNR